MKLRIVDFYIQGFKSMTLGKTLWRLIFIKLLIIFGVLKLFFFGNHLNEKFETDSEKAGHVLTTIIQQKATSDGHTSNLEKAK